MDRRTAVRRLAALGVGTSPFGAWAQTTRRERPFRIGVVPDALGEKWFVEAMGTLGWTEGADFTVLRSGYSDGDPNLDDAVRRVVAGNVDLIYVSSTAGAISARRLTSTVPIVMFSSGYPVEAGLANSLARPGKNVTGNTQYAGTGVWGKLPELLHEASPAVRRISAFWTYGPPKFAAEESEMVYKEFAEIERALRLSIQVIKVATPDDAARGLARLEAGRADALIVTASHGLGIAQEVMRFAVNRRLPTITDWHWPTTIEPYPLLSYGPPMAELARTSLTYIDRIMKGAKPGDLPIQQPAKFALVVNLKTANAIGLQVPQALLLRADEVIQ